MKLIRPHPFPVFVFPFPLTTLLILGTAFHHCCIETCGILGHALRGQNPVPHLPRKPAPSSRDKSSRSLCPAVATYLCTLTLLGKARNCRRICLGCILGRSIMLGLAALERPWMGRPHKSTESPCRLSSSNYHRQQQSH